SSGKNISQYGKTMSDDHSLSPSGFNATVLVRDPSQLPTDHKASRVVVGDVLNRDDVRKTLEGQDAVIIILGTRNNLSPTTVMSEGTRNILDVMKERGIRKVVACMSGDPPHVCSVLSPMSISKHDLGHFFVQCLSTTSWDGKTVGSHSFL
uniref:Biliverdin reductase B n=1 Tax=Neogobius melanostomus TaxID=47308 RepID=A0A8C6T6R6_9GOBI